MERGSSKHSARVDEQEAAEVRGRLGNHGGHREEWAETEPREGVENRIERTELPPRPLDDPDLDEG
ncbi:hypothetical protein ACQP04_03265 [Pseudonocardia halophobica]|uniref:hypothetical protein n=1 Tax=Pseudonocardia halophobica TaxID=29401 RepID=UPI003D8BC856